MSLTDGMSILLKGPFGNGKTLAAASMAMDGPVWLAYWDKKKPYELIKFFQYRDPKILKNLDIDIYSAQNAHQFLNKLNTLINDCPYYGIINDSVTMMTASAVNWSLGFRNPSGGKKDEINPAAMKMIPDFDEYKVETSMVTQALDICRMLPCNVIWTAHPLNGISISGAGKSIQVTKTNPIVSYGTKVASIVPGQFTEIYHFALENSWDAARGKAGNKRVVHTKPIGDDFAKTALGLPDELDITDRMFWEVWKAAVKESMPADNGVKEVTE